MLLLHDITYTDDNGDEQNAYDYLMKDGNLGVPGGRYGRDTRDCADIAILLFLVLADSTGEDTLDALEGCMSMVVNSSDEVCWTILDNRHVFDRLDLHEKSIGRPPIKLNPFAYFDEDEVAYSRDLYAMAYDGLPANF